MFQEDTCSLNWETGLRWLIFSVQVQILLLSFSITLERLVSNPNYVAFFIFLFFLSSGQVTYLRSSFCAPQMSCFGTFSPKKACRTASSSLHHSFFFSPSAHLCVVPRRRLEWSVALLSIKIPAPLAEPHCVLSHRILWSHGVDEP